MTCNVLSSDLGRLQGHAVCGFQTVLQRYFPLCQKGIDDTRTLVRELHSPENGVQQLINVSQQGKLKRSVF
jgi:hypothetical protein